MSDRAPFPKTFIAFAGRISPRRRQQIAEQLQAEQPAAAPPAKPATELLPPDVMLAVADLLGDSAVTHAGHDFSDGRPWSVDYAALQRHLLTFWAGEDADPGSGRSHVIHIAARSLLLATAVLRHPDHDDRPRLTRPPTGPPES